MSQLRNKESKRLYEQQERQRLEAIAAPILARNAALEKKIAETVAAKIQEMYSIPLEELQARVSWGGWEDQLTDAVAFKPYRVKPGDARVIDECSKFLRSLPSQGFTKPTPAVAHRFGIYVESQANAGADMTDPTNIRLAWNRCFGLGIFGGDVTRDPNYRQPEPEPVPEPEKSFDHKLNECDSTREGTRRARELVEKEVFSKEVAAVWSQWLSSLVSNFDYVPGEDTKRKIYDIFMEKNLSWLDRRSYDLARRLAVEREIFPKTLLTRDEALAREIDGAGDTGEYHTRQAIRNRLRDGLKRDPEILTGAAQ